MASLQSLDPSSATRLGMRRMPHTYAALCSGGKFLLYPHIAYVGERIAHAVRKGRGRLIVNMPPRHGKSEQISFWTPAWYLDQNPASRVILCSYQADIAADFGRKVRNEVDENPAIGVSLREDSTSASRWNTPEGGGMVTAGVGGPITGRGFDLGIIDDPLKNWQDAFSPTVRRRQIDWFQSTFYTRAEPDATMIVLATRWHPGDLCGWLTEKHEDDWEVINLPAIAEVGDPLGREPGQALCPHRYDVDDLELIRAAVGPAKWDSLYQQRPTGNATGRLYTAFTDANIDKAIDFNPALPVHISIDWNLNPGMHIEVGQHQPMTDRFAAIHEIHAPRMSLNAAAQAFVSLWRKIPSKPAVWLFGDATGVSIEDGNSYGVLFKRHLIAAGIQIRDKIPASNPPVIDRVAALNEALCDSGTGLRRVAVHPRCERLLADLREVMADDEGKPDKSELDLTHASDCAGYWVHYLSPIRLHAKRTSRGRIGGGSSRG